MLRRLLGRLRTETSPTPPEQACADADPAVRLAAVRRLSDLGRLLQLRRDDTDDRVREAAAERLRMLFIGGDGSLTMAQRLAGLQACTDATLLAHVARRAREAELRLVAVRGVSGERLLAEVAVEDTNIRVRLAALERITSPERLAELEPLLRQSDERLARLARYRHDSLVRACRREPGLSGKVEEATARRRIAG